MHQYTGDNKYSNFKYLSIYVSGMRNSYSKLIGYLYRRQMVIACLVASTSAQKNNISIREINMANLSQIVQFVKPILFKELLVLCFATRSIGSCFCLDGQTVRQSRAPVKALRPRWPVPQGVIGSSAITQFYRREGASCEEATRGTSRGALFTRTRCPAQS